MNIRWDAAAISAKSLTEPPVWVEPQVSTSERVPAHVWLFGTLSLNSAPRPLVVDLPSGFTLLDLIVRLREHFDSDFLKDAIDSQNRLVSQCRVFINGRLVEELGVPVSAGVQANIEIIMLGAIEGG